MLLDDDHVSAHFLFYYTLFSLAVVGVCTALMSGGGENEQEESMRERSTQQESQARNNATFLRLATLATILTVARFTYRSLWPGWYVPP